MARKRKKKKNLLDYIAIPRLPEFDLEDDTKKSIWAVFLIAVGAISILGLLNMAGMFGKYLTFGSELLFGWGKWVVPVVIILLGFFLFAEEKFDFRGFKILGLVIFVLTMLTLMQLIVDPDSWGEGLREGFGGGYIGYFIASNLIILMGFWASIISMIALLLVSLMIVFNTNLNRLIGKESLLSYAVYPFALLASKIFKKSEKEEGEEEEEEDEEEEEEEHHEDEDEEEEEEEHHEDEEENEDEEEEDEGEEEEGEDEGSREEGSINELFDSRKVKDVETEDEPAELWPKTGVKIKLPLTLLDSNKEKPSSGDIKANTEKIKSTLENFGIDVEMGAVQVGPTVTQYTFKPAEGVKLSKITALNNDLALALAAHPIRIEAPIPGKALVGVEVPNHAKAVVSLKEILKSKAYKERKTNMTIALGKDVSGKSWMYDLTKMPHLLVAGATNSGKSVCLNAIIISLFYQNNPDDLKFIMVDPKRVEMTAYNDLPYLMTPVITDVNKTINALKWCLNEMDRRYEVLSKKNKKNIQSYNEAYEDKMPYIVFVIDELADLMVAAAKEIEGSIIRLAQMARAVGIHLILATQRPSVDVITGLIKANMPARIAFSVASGTDSRTILDSLGAEKLLGMGDMLFQTAEISKPVRLQGAFLGEKETKKITVFIKKKGGEFEYTENVTDRQKVKGVAGVGLDGTHGDEDELLEEAKEVVINAGKCSTSFLQRKLRIGYSRAASIVDQLEEHGIVGPANGSKPREVMITKEQYARMTEEGVSAVSLHRREEAQAPDSYLGEDDEDNTGVPPEFMNDEDESSDVEASEEEEGASEEEFGKYSSK